MYLPQTQVYNRLLTTWVTSRYVVMRICFMCKAPK